MFHMPFKPLPDFFYLYQASEKLSPLTVCPSFLTCHSWNSASNYTAFLKPFSWGPYTLSTGPNSVVMPFSIHFVQFLCDIWKYYFNLFWNSISRFSGKLTSASPTSLPMICQFVGWHPILHLPLMPMSQVFSWYCLSLSSFFKVAGWMISFIYMAQAIIDILTYLFPSDFLMVWCSYFDSIFRKNFFILIPVMLKTGNLTPSLGCMKLNVSLLNSNQSYNA